MLGFPTRSSLERARLGAGLAVLLLAAAPAIAALRDPTAETRAGLDLLHQGRFEEAASYFERQTRDRPADPEGPLFEAMAAWWRLLERPKNRDLTARLEERLGEGIRRAEALIGGPDAQRGRVLSGTALLLTAQRRAAEGGFFGAGSAARQGCRRLEEALEADPEDADAWFAYGAYKYFADRMPWLVRALRVFFFIPGGDARRGLEGLKAAAERGRYFRTEAHLLLADIYSGDRDPDPTASLEHAAAARALAPPSPLLAAVEARLAFGAGRLSRAERCAREAIELAAASPGVAAEIAALARLRLGYVLYYQYRPEEASEEVKRLQARTDLVPEAWKDSLEALGARLRSDLAIRATAGSAEGGADGRPEQGAPRPAPAAPLPKDPRAAAALALLRDGRAAEAARALSEASAASPADLVLRYHLARAHQASDRLEEAQALLRLCVEDGADLPRTLRGWALIRLGAALESQGRRREAEAHYRKAASLRGFVFRKAAEDRLIHPDGGSPPEA